MVEDYYAEVFEKHPLWPVMRTYIFLDSQGKLIFEWKKEEKASLIPL